jgi:hypothetical protein
VHLGARFADLVRCLAERGELGPGDVDEIVAARVRAAQQSARFYTERTTLGGRILAARTNPGRPAASSPSTPTSPSAASPRP